MASIQVVYCNLRHKGLIAGLAAVFLLFSVCSKAESWQTYTQTQHPIVLSHGFLGFESMLDFIHYWPGIVRALERSGASVHITQVSPVSSSYLRGEQLIEQLEALQASYGYQRFNLIGHSQGTLDARYVAHVRPDLVASVTSIAGPHNSRFLDGVPDINESPLLKKLAMWGLTSLGKLIASLSHNEYALDGEGALAFFSKTELDAFNEAYPAALPDSYCGEGAYVVNIEGYDIRFYSWSGVALITTGWDPTDYLMAATGKVISGPSDGLVTQCASHLGEVIRDDYKHNHLDEVNLMFGLVPYDEIHPKTIFRLHANRMKQDGL